MNAPESGRKVRVLVAETAVVDARGANVPGGGYIAVVQGRGGARRE